MRVDLTLVLVCRLCLGIFFLVSAFGELGDMRRFVRGTINYRVLPERFARVFGYTLPWIELLLAIALLTGFILPVSGLAAMLLLAAFIVAVIINLYRGRLIECNCHGIASTRTISLGTIIRNLLLLLLAGVVSVISATSEATLWITQRNNDRMVLVGQLG